MKGILLGLIIVAAPGAAAEQLSPELVAKIRREQKAAQADIEKAHGGKKSSQMDSAERREVIRKQAEAEREILEKYQVEAKDYARYSAKMTKEDRQRAQEAEDGLEAAEKKKAETAPGTEAPPIEVEHGIPVE